MTNIFQIKYQIDEAVCKSLEAIGYTSPLPVQEEVMPHILAGKDLIVRSNTGSGKTAAFGIPIAHGIDLEEMLPQALILTPTRELAVQVCEEIADIGRYKKVRCLPIYGKQPIHIQLRQLKQRVHVAVGTPGRLIDLIRKKHLNLDAIKYLVIDEADELLKRGFLEDVQKIISKVPAERTTLLFSATMPPEIKAVCQTYMVEPLSIEMESNQVPLDSIKQSYIHVAADYKLRLLLDILGKEDPAKCMIFCNTRAKVDDLYNKMVQGRYPCAALHGKMAQSHRLRAIADFKTGKIPYLIATDLAGRGIHIDRLDLVINYNLPQDDENYVHRIGRTGRVGQSGKAISFVTPYDKKRFNEIEDYLGFSIAEDKVYSLHNMATDPTENNRKPSKKPKKKPQQHPKKHKDITKIRLNAGKKKKIRPGDILGAISNLPGIQQEDIGIIDIRDTCSYVEIFHSKGPKVLKALEHTKIKGRVIGAKKVSNRSK